MVKTQGTIVNPRDWLKVSCGKRRPEQSTLAALESQERDDMEQEIPLEGGNANNGVVRIGETVRRETSASSRSVHRLLDAIRSAGFSKAPKYLGLDEKNREILSYIEGSCSVESEYWSDERYLVSAGELLKAFHDASATYIAEDDDVWAYEYPDKNCHEVICHNDFAPYNLIANVGEFVSVIDFDLAGPGPRIRDVAYAAYWLVPLSQRAENMKTSAVADTKNGSERLKQFCAICGVPADQALLNMLGDVLAHMSSEQVMIDMLGHEAAGRLKADGHLEHWMQEAEAFNEYRASIERNL